MSLCTLIYGPQALIGIVGMAFFLFAWNAKATGYGA
jgi:hypothetical protein